MTALATSLLSGLVGASALFALTFVATRLPAIKRRPALAAAMWLVVLARFLFPIPIGGDLSIEAQIAALFGESSVLLPTAAGAASLGPQTAAVSATPMWLSVASALWLSISMLLLATTIGGALRTRRRLRRLPPASPQLQARAQRIADSLGIKLPRLVVGAESPLTFGAFQPIVALPDWLTDERADHVLAHELAHVRRRDCLWALIARAAQIVFFFVPFVWIASRQFAAAREEATDEAALAATGASSLDYADTLVKVSSRLLASPGLLMAAKGSQLRSRIGGVLGARREIGVGLVGALILAGQVLIALPGSADAKVGASVLDDCDVTAGMGAQIMSEYPEADRDGDGTLTREEICAHQQRLREIDGDDQGELFSEAMVPICTEELRCTGDGAEAFLY